MSILYILKTMTIISGVVHDISLDTNGTLTVMSISTRSMTL